MRLSDVWFTALSENESGQMITVYGRDELNEFIEPQAHGGTLEHREQLLNHQGAGGGTRRTWRFRV